MTERKVEILLDAIEKTEDDSFFSYDHSARPVRKFNALDLIGKANTAVITLGSLHHSEEIEDLTLGIKTDGKNLNNLSNLYFFPLIEIFVIIRNNLLNIFSKLKMIKK